MAFDTLEYLRRGGRIGKAQAFLGTMLKVSPILGIKDGEAYPFTREHSRAKAIDHLYDFATGFSHIDEMAVEHATTPDEAEMLVKRLKAKFPKDAYLPLQGKPGNRGACRPPGAGGSRARGQGLAYDGQDCHR